MATTAMATLIKMVEQLPESERARVVEHLKNYLADNQAAPPRGKAGEQLIRFAGLIPYKDLEQISDAIEIGCEQIDPNEW